MYIYIDESGDLASGKGTEYFVIGAIFHYKKIPEEIDKVIKKHNNHLLCNGWPKDIEIKATHLYNYKRHITDLSVLRLNPRLYLQNIYKDINKLDIKFGALINKTASMGPMLSCLHKEKIYNYLSKQLYKKCLPFLRDTMDIFVDQRNITLIKKQRHVDLSVQRLNLDYIGYITNILTFLYSKKHNIQPIVNISFNASQKIKGLQVVDYVAWAVRRKFEGKPYWYNLLTRLERIEEKDNFI